MKKILLTLSALILSTGTMLAQHYEYKILTSVESIVPGGLGRSRLVENKGEVNLSQLTTERASGTDSKQNKVSRKDAKIDELAETKMLNFYSLTGINFQNIASNDAIIQTRMNELSREGWELAFMTSGVESDAGDKDGNGIFVTRFVFKRLSKD
jgi:hypothetical protein